MTKDKQRVMSFMRSLPILASVLGRKFGVKIIIGHGPASTDGTTIHLPPLPIDGGEELFILANGFLDHEASHIRDTDFKELQSTDLSPLAHQLWNIVEDVRVEREMVKVYPGCREHFRKLYIELSKRIEPCDPAMGAENIFRWLMYAIFHEQYPDIGLPVDAYQEAVEDQFPYLIGQLVPFVPTGLGCGSTAEGIEWAKSVEDFLFQYFARSKPKPAEQKASDDAPQEGNEEEAGSGEADSGNSTDVGKSEEQDCEVSDASADTSAQADAADTPTEEDSPSSTDTNGDLDDVNSSTDSGPDADDQQVPYADEADGPAIPPEDCSNADPQNDGQTGEMSSAPEDETGEAAQDAPEVPSDESSPDAGGTTGQLSEEHEDTATEDSDDVNHGDAPESQQEAEPVLGAQDALDEQEQDPERTDGNDGDRSGDQDQQDEPQDSNGPAGNGSEPRESESAASDGSGDGQSDTSLKGTTSDTGSPPAGQASDASSHEGGQPDSGQMEEQPAQDGSDNRTESDGNDDEAGMEVSIESFGRAEQSTMNDGGVCAGPAAAGSQGESEAGYSANGSGLDKDGRSSESEQNNGTDSFDTSGIDMLDKIIRGEDLPELSDEARESLGAMVNSESGMAPSFGELLKQMLEQASAESWGKDCIQVAMVKGDLPGELARPIIEQAQSATRVLATRLSGLLQTQTLSRMHTGRRGRIDGNRLHRLALENPRVFKRPAETYSIDTAVHILLDCSSSMVECMSLANAACYSVASSLHRICGVNVGVTAFPGEWDYEDRCTVSPILKHGQRMHMRFAAEAHGCTPMGEALWWTCQQMMHLKEDRKIILVITDGYPNSFRNTELALEAAHDLGIETIGIGIGEHGTFILNLIKNSSVINEIQELAPAMFGVLQQALTERRL